MAKEILSYFLRNPHAADSLEGIASWRLLEETIHRRVEDARRALDWLVAEGYLKEMVSGGTAPLYSLDQEKRREAQLLSADEREGVLPLANGGDKS